MAYSHVLLPECPTCMLFVQARTSRCRPEMFTNAAFLKRTSIGRSIESMSRRLPERCRQWTEHPRQALEEIDRCLLHDI